MNVKKISKISVFIMIFTIISILLTGCFGGTGGSAESPTKDPNATLEPAKDPEKGFNTYEGEGFSIDYHKEWYVIYEKDNSLSEEESKENLRDPSEVVICVKNQSKDTSDNKNTLYPTISVYKDKKEKAETALEDYTKTVLEELKKSVDSIGFPYKAAGEKEYKSITINEQAGYVIEYSGAIQNSGNFTVKQIFMEKNEEVYIISYVAVPADYDDKEYMDIVDLSVNSFKIK